jgi:hypothetical protein
MSHVSQNALENFDVLEDVRLQFMEDHGIDKPSLSEIAAFYMVGTREFAEMLRLASQLIPQVTMPARPCNEIQNMIVGKAISEELPLLHELISGPFDADKLDYMTRDARMTGVPDVTDIPRLVQKVRAVELGLGDLPVEVQERVSQQRPSFWLTGISASGGRTLDELLIGRILLFDKIYRHHKVRAAEAMVAGIFQELGPLCESGPIGLFFSFDDARIFELDTAFIEHLHGKPLTVTENERAQRAIELSQRLRNRRLFVRAYAFAQNMPLDPYLGDDEHTSGLHQLAVDCADSVVRGQLAEKVVEQLNKILVALGRDDVLNQFPSGNIKPYVWIDPPKAPSGTVVIGGAYLIGGGRKPVKYLDNTAEAPSWTNAYLLTRDTGYVFTTRELAPYAFIATERVIRETYGVRTPRSMIDYAKQNAKLIEELKVELAESGYYNKAPVDVRPRPFRLTRGDVPSRLSAVAERLMGYEGPVNVQEIDALDLKEEKRIPLATRARMENWLHQFETDELIDAGLHVLEKIAFVDRLELVSGLSDFLRANSEFHNGILCPLGEPKDSSSILTYHAQDAGTRFGLAVKEIEQAIGERKPIVFVDDFIGRGSQSISILENWLDEELTYDLKEERRSPLDPKLRELFRDIPLAFVFSAGTITGGENLKARCESLKLNAQVVVVNSALPTVNDVAFTSENQQRTFIQKCREIALPLLVDEELNHHGEWANERLLGYGNEGYLLVFPYNTPTQALTVLWASKKGNSWEPLFPRRKKR